MERRLDGWFYRIRFASIWSNRQIEIPRSVWISTKVAGRSNAGRFQPNPAELTLAEVEEGYTPAGTSVTCLPKTWAAYRALYNSGQRVVLEYTVGPAQVLE